MENTNPLAAYNRQAYLNWYEQQYPNLPEWPPYPRTNYEAAEYITQYTGRHRRLPARPQVRRIP